MAQCSGGNRGRVFKYVDSRKRYMSAGNVRHFEVSSKIIPKQGDKLGWPSASDGKGKFNETQRKKRVYLSFSARAPKNTDDLLTLI